MKRFLCFFLAFILLCCWSGAYFTDAEESMPATIPSTSEPTSEPATTVPPTTEPTDPTTVPTGETEPTTLPTTEVPTEAPTEEPTEPAVVLTLSEQILANMTLEEKVGQIFLARCPKENAAQDVAAYHLGGFVLFAKDFAKFSPEEVKANIASYQNASPIPLLIAVDEEGGLVTRVSCYSQFRDNKFPSPRDLFEKGGLELIIDTETEKIALLSSLGVNVNLAPVCDVTNDSNAFMYDRSLGQSPEVTGQYISSVVELMNQHQFGSVLKHFPGYGNNTDTHVGIAIDERSLETLEAVDLVPFTYGIASDAQAIMISHTIINCLDKEQPASLSPTVIGYLRNNMGFDGVVVTDDLIMQAITKQYGAEEAAVLAVLAGNDLLCSSEYQIQYAAVLEAVHSGRISTDLLDRAVLRVLNWKEHLGLLE